MDVEEPRVRMASENSERIEQALASVVPFVVVQRGRITYINEAGATCLGYENGDNSLLGASAEVLVGPTEWSDFSRDLRYALRSPRVGSPRQLVTRTGQRFLATTMTARVTWAGEPASGIAFVPLKEPVATAEGATRVPRDSSVQALAMLSPRQAQIARLLALGFSPGNIAAHLDLSVETVRTHIKSIYHKVGIRCRVDLVRMVLDMDAQAS
jgi:PAS domain S-box-containing protein